MTNLARTIDRFIDALGRGVSWLTLGMVLIGSAIVIMRYFLSIGFQWLQELVIYMHATVILVGGAYALRHNGHVRVDFLYERWPAKWRERIDFLGTLLFTIPLCVAIFVFSFDYVLNSWATLEGSGDQRGIPGVFLLKTLQWVFAILVGAQAVAILCRRGRFTPPRANND